MSALGQWARAIGDGAGKGFKGKGDAATDSGKSSGWGDGFGGEGPESVITGTIQKTWNCRYCWYDYWDDKGKGKLGGRNFGNLIYGDRVWSWDWGKRDWTNFALSKGAGKDSWSVHDKNWFLFDGEWHWDGVASDSEGSGSGSSTSEESKPSKEAERAIHRARSFQEDQAKAAAKAS
jgi:hypothetical protein